MNVTVTTSSLSERLKRRPIVLAAGVCNALTALIAERSGFEALYVSGAGIAYTQLGRSDIGLVSLACGSLCGREVAATDGSSQ